MEEKYVQIKKVDGSKFENGYSTAIARKAQGHNDANKHYYLYVSGFNNIVIDAELCVVWQTGM